MKDMLYLVSKCLLGENCRYDGKNSFNIKVINFLEGKDYIAVCPEELGGLSTPRIPCEIKNGEVIGKNGKNFTTNFRIGSQKAFENLLNRVFINKKEKIEVCAILKSKSPSCGKGLVYDGNFQGTLIQGNGIFVEYLKKHITDIEKVSKLEIVTEYEVNEIEESQMKDYRSEIGKIISKVIGQVGELDVTSLIEVPTDDKMGDYAFPCFRLAKELRKAPNIIAAEIAEEMKKESIFDSVESVNAYVNMKIKRADFIENVMEYSVLKGNNFMQSHVGKGKTVLIDYSSPNIAKPFHIGHIRTTVIGNALYLIYKNLGYDVVRINHLGDYGTQFGKMIVAYRKWGNKEDVEKNPIKTLLSYYTKFHEEAEKNPELDDEARKTFVKLEKGEKEEVELWKWFKEESLKEFDKVYKMLDIEFDSYAGEAFYSDKIPAAVAELEAKNLLQESQNSTIVNLEEFGLPPALVKKSDGSTLYITRDIAAALYRKKTYDFYKCLYVVASQQDLHFKQLFKVMELMGNEWAKNCIHVQFGMVSLKEGTLSTRKGRVVFLEDVLNKAIEKTREVIIEKGVVSEDIDKVASEVGIGAVVFNELAHNRIKDYTFDWDKVLNFEGETGPYVQYTHARSCSILRKADSKLVLKAQNLEGIDYGKLTTDTIYELVKLIHKLPEVINEAAERYEPSVITRHIVKIAQGFNRFYNEERILQEDETETISKLAVVMAARNAIRNGLALLGIKSPERM